MSTHATPPADDIRPEPLARALGERYLAYALSTIMNRALPDVRDGLKPVHRRLLYAMRELGLDPDSAFKKCARVVGDVIGKFHPHGDQAVYDALVRLAQDFAARYPLVEGQGNFGNIDGDNPAAMRYTESRLTLAAQMLLAGLDEDGADFRATYDGSDREPVVLPGAFPNLLANGAAGIAVGMATSIPPHNVHEICDALLHLLKTPNARDETLLQHIKGPDFPTGGLIVESRESMAEAYRTGRGGFRVRAKWHKEEGPRGTYIIVVTQIPYQVQKSRLIEKIAELISEKKVSMLADVRDESAEDVRLVLEPRARTVDAALLMEQLFRLTDLETRFPLNMNVLDGAGVPRVMSLKETLRAFLDHRREVLLRRSRFRLEKIARRLEVLEGYLAVYLNLDKVIKIIREEDEPKPKLMKAFGLADAQAEAILNMRLRSLRRLEEMEIRGEHAALTKERAELSKMLNSEDLQWQRVAAEVREVQTAFGAKTVLGKRRSAFDTAPVVEDIAPEAFIEREPITVLCSEKGWIRAMKGHLDDVSDVKYKEGDRARFVVMAETTDKLVLFATNGRFYTLGCDKLPGGRGMGEPVRLMAEMAEGEDLVAMFVHQPGRELLIASSSGHGFRVSEDETIALRKAGKQIMSLADGAEAAALAFVQGDTAGVIGENRKALFFPLDEIPVMAKGRGVTLQRYKDGALSDVTAFSLKEGLKDRNGRTWPKAELADWIGARGQAGRLAPKGFPKNNKF